MKKQTTDARVKARGKNRARATDAARVREEIHTGSLAIIGGASTLFSIWSLACCIGGLIEAGGPIGFVKSWLTAVGGM